MCPETEKFPKRPDGFEPLLVMALRSQKLEGLFLTRAVREGDSYPQNGQKTFTRLGPVIDLFMITVTVQTSDTCLVVGTFSILSDMPGVTIIENWDILTFGRTAIHDLTNTDCRVSVANAVHLRPISEILPDDICVFARFSSRVAPIYTGIVIAGLNFAGQFANDDKPSPRPWPIKYLPNLLFAVAQEKTLLAENRAYMFETANLAGRRRFFWSGRPPARVYTQKLCNQYCDSHCQYCHRSCRRSRNVESTSTQAV